MSDDAMLAELLDQERRLVFDRFDNDTAIALGLALIERARAERLAVTVDVARGEQQLFHAALPGTSADNGHWIERKKAVVRRFGHSSFYMGMRSRSRGLDFATQYLVDPRQFGAHGGCFPIIVRNVGPVGTVTASGLPQEEDHRLVVAVLEAFLAKDAASAE